MAKFDQYLYDPMNPETPAIIKKNIPEFNFDCPDIEGLIKYTVYTYDPHCDLLRIFPTDFNRRKREAAIKAGFSIGADGKFDEWVEDCIVGDNDQYNTALVAFVTSFNIADLPAYVMYREVFYSEFQAAITKKDSKEKKESIINAENARQQMIALETKLFSDVETVNVRSALYVLAEKVKLSLRPEDKAREIDTKSLTITDPYYGRKRRSEIR